jgi:arsenate reductase (glutaredoxin)
MSDVTIYHNPRCTKSRQTLELLQERGIEPNIVEYLKTPPSADELKSILEKLGMFAQEIMRTGEPEYKELGLFNARYTEDGLIDIMVKHPKLIERPIVVKGDKAAIGRPPENVLAIL